MPVRPFRFGAQVASAGSAAEWRDLARRLEDQGFSSLLMPDHFDDQLAPMPAMAAAAASTSTLRVASLVLDNDYKHPVVLAKEAATLDLLSDGRLELGVGAGWMRSDYEASGITYDRAGVRIDRFEEGLAVMKGLLSGQPFSFSGKHYTITDLSGTPKPVQQPHPPILIGAGAPRMLALAAREADIISVNFDLNAGEVGPDVVKTGTGELTAQKVDLIRQAAGERFDDIELSVTIFMGAITDDRRSLAEVVGANFGQPPEMVLGSPHLLAGTVDEIVEELQAVRERLGFSYIVFGGGSYNAMAPVVERLAGT